MTSAPPVRLRALLWAAVALQGALLVAQLLLEVRLLRTSSPADGGLPVVVTGIVSVAAFPVVGAVLLRKRPENPIGWLFCTAMIGWAVNNAAAPYVRLGVAVDPAAAPATELAVWLYTWPGFLSVALMVLLLVLFPDGRLPSERWRSLVWATVVTMTLAAGGAAFAPGPVDPSLMLEVDNPLGADGVFGGALVLIRDLGFPVAILLIAAAVVSLAQRYRRSRGIERAQMKWFVAGVVAWAGSLLVFLAAALRYPSFQGMPFWAEVAALTSILGGAVIPVTAAVAVLRYRLYEIDRIVSRTVSYAVVTAVLAGVYVGAVVGLGAVARALTGGGGGGLVVAVSTLAVAALFGPLRRRVQRAVDRRFNRARYDAVRTVESFAQRLRDEVDVATIRTELGRTVAAAVQPGAARVWLVVDEKPRPAGHAGSVTVPERSGRTTEVVISDRDIAGGIAT